MSNEMQLIQAIVSSIRPKLAGQAPGIQGAVLADLLSMWLAGHPKGVREEILRMHLDHVRRLVDVNERLMFKGAGHPDDRQ